MENVAATPPPGRLVRTVGVLADTIIDLVGAIGRAVVAYLLPERRIRVKPA